MFRTKMSFGFGVFITATGVLDLYRDKYFILVYLTYIDHLAIHMILSTIQQY